MLVFALQKQCLGAKANRGNTEIICGRQFTPLVVSNSAPAKQCVHLRKASPIDVCVGITGAICGNCLEKVKKDKCRQV